MKLKALEVKICCFCCPLRWGIILFGYINLLFSIVTETCLLIQADLLKAMVNNDTSLELATSTILFGILGMGVILNILLLVAGYKKDVALLRLYNFYAFFTTLAALVPTLILLSQMQFLIVVATLFAIVMQCYVIILVRSEIVKLEENNIPRDEENFVSTEESVDVPDRDTLL